MEPADALSLVILYLGAFITPLVAGRLHIPAAVGEILFGVAVGSSGLRLVHPTDFTNFLSALGFIFLMFLVGMEIDFNHIEREGGKSVALALVVAAAVLGMGGVLAWQLGYRPFVGVILGAMSVGIMLVALLDVGSSQSRFGQMLLLVGSIGEFLTLLAITGFDLVHQHGFSAKLGQEVVRVVLLFVVVYVVLAVLRLVVWWFPHRFQRWVDVEDPSEIGVRAGFVLMLSLAALSGWVGLEPILGAFLAGALFTFVFREKGILETKLSALGQGFFVPLFFIHVGLSFDYGALGDWRELLTVLTVFGGASLLAKTLPCLLLLFAGFRLREIVGGALLLASPLTLLVAAASIGQQLDVLRERTASAVVLFAIISGVAFPTLFKLLHRPGRRAPLPETKEESVMVSLF